MVMPLIVNSLELIINNNDNGTDNEFKHATGKERYKEKLDYPGHHSCAGTMDVQWL
jgi:hypothetical protein